MNVLEVEKLRFAYEDGTVALKDIDLTLGERDKVAVLGPNGAGKSTLLQLIAGFRTPFEGEVRIDSRLLTERSSDTLRRYVGLVFQDPDDQIFMPTVEEDVAFGPRNLKLEDVSARVEKALKDVGIGHLAKRKPHRLSYGMKKRVAIAGVLAMDPKILLLDEPTSGLDPRSRLDLVHMLRSMQRPMLIATHDLEACAEIVDRAIVLNITMIAHGTMRELVTSRGVLESAGLEPPPVSRLFMELDRIGYPVDSLPVSMDQAVTELERMMEGNVPKRSA